jgi:hypothetical protein
MKWFCYYIGVVFFLITAGCNPADKDLCMSPDVISEQVKDELGNSMRNEKKSLSAAPAFESAVTSEYELFSFSRNWEYTIL